MDNDETTTANSAAKRQPRLVVGVGASAGGLEAFKELLPALPVDSGMTFLLVQHLDPTHKSLLTELIAPTTSMSVMDAEQGLELRPDVIYVIRPDTALGVRDGRIELSTPKLHRGVRLPVDYLFSSLASEYGLRAAGIVLSGAGSDGCIGLRDLRAAGGLTLAQAPETASQSGMPQSAIETGAVDLVLPIAEMPAALARFDSLPIHARTAAVPPPEEGKEEGDGDDRPEGTHLGEETLQQLAALLEAHHDFDLRVYKSGTVERRLWRRMTLAGFDSIEPYMEHLREAYAEQAALLRDLLISVTDFFRDRTAYEALRATVVEPLVAAAKPRDTLRVWVPGCATGEEAYSLGIEFLEAIEESGKHLSLQIFATDVDEEALATARAGIYPASLIEQLPADRAERHFKLLEGRGYQVQNKLREALSFASHDLTKDPPFSRMHLVSCRNVLIYLRSDAQERVLHTLHFALQPDSYLFLGTSESTGRQRGLFATLSKRWRIFRKVGASRPPMLPRQRQNSTEHLEEAAQKSGGGVVLATVDDRRNAPGTHARRAVMEARVAPTIVVAESGDVLFMHGELRPYLRFPDGEPRFEISSLVTPELATRARAALYKCRRDQETVVALSSPDGEHATRTRITATPAPEVGDGAVILTFESAPANEAESVAPRVAENPAEEVVIDQLERELKATREDLRNTVEELESANEELRSSNEEAMSMNEELQSANEELEATTEELRSLNEELITVNTQLRDKIEQLETAHDDLNNFFASTKIATLFLDSRLAIKRFTPAAEELIRIDHGDLGRQVGDIARDLLQNDLVAEAEEVLEHLSPKSRELHTDEDRWIIRRVLPYRTENRRIEGVVVT
ncbi:MAG TPA: chemotaxis protein CheB, partial [Thermoanaerobaculia bacterium]|nr:chemotaxis protein CheB [Thermoanaerobaculia bacterium]